MKLAVMGLAKDCGEEAVKTLENLFKVCDDCGFELCCVVGTNDNSDDTYEVLKKFGTTRRGFETICVDGLINAYPDRNARIAFLRNLTLKTLRERSIEFDLLIVVDLDGVATSLDANSLQDAITVITTEGLAGVFPVSNPVYYDLFALRCKHWLNTDIFWIYWPLRLLLPFVPKHKLFRAVCKRFQKPINRFGRLTPVESAFGGLGIYNWKDIEGVWYGPQNKYGVRVCEHVSFNKQITGKLAIFNGLVCDAPKEHY